MDIGIILIKTIPSCCVPARIFTVGMLRLRIVADSTTRKLSFGCLKTKLVKFWSTQDETFKNAEQLLLQFNKVKIVLTATANCECQMFCKILYLLTFSNVLVSLYCMKVLYESNVGKCCRKVL